MEKMAEMEGKVGHRWLKKKTTVEKTQQKTEKTRRVCKKTGVLRGIEKKAKTSGDGKKKTNESIKGLSGWVTRLRNTSLDVGVDHGKN